MPDGVTTMVPARKAADVVAERDAAREAKPANRKDAKLAKFAADYAIALANDAAPPDMSVLSQRERDKFRKHFLAHAVEHYPGRKASNRDEYVIEVDAGAEIKRQGVRSPVDFHTQVSKDGGDLDGKRPSPKLDALWLLDQAYADAGTKGSDVFRNDLMRGGLWAAVLHKDRKRNQYYPADDVVAYYTSWLPPWKRS